MKFYHTDIVEKVRKDRAAGSSIRTLHKKFNISETTLSRWSRDIPSSAPAFLKARQHEALLKNTLSHLAENYKIDRDNARVLLSLLYWCEGSKYPSETCVAFSNSDWKLVKVFLELLRTGFSVSEEKLRAKLQIHATHDYAQILSFWSEHLKIPSAQFHRPTITQPTHRRKRRNYLGTCTVKYYDVTLLLQISGLFEAFSKKW